MNRFFILIMCLFLIAACKPPKAQRQEQRREIIVKEEVMQKSLYFAGNISPADIVMVAAPTTGTVQELLVQYGEPVKKGDPLVLLKSDDFQHEFSTALSSYLKSKDQYEQNKVKLDSAKLLYKDGLIPENEMVSMRSTYYGSYLSFLESEAALNKLLATSSDEIKVESLSINNIDEINTLLDTHHHDKKITVYADADGIILLPPGSENTEKLKRNTSVKANATLFAIGNVDSLSVDIEVNEMDINALRVGLPAVVTTLALPGEKLKAEVVDVAAQANVKQSSAPVFTCKIQIKKLTAKQREKLRVGMSAKVMITLDSAPNIVVPIEAVSLKDRRPVVMVKHGHTLEERVIEPGETNQQQVVINHGLQPGEHIVVN